MNETYATIQGRLVADPEVRHTRAGQPFTTMRVAVTVRRPVAGQPGQYEDAGTSYYNVSAFRAMGANMAASFHKGEPVVVYGRLRVRQYERDDKTYGTSAEMEAYAAGHDLTYGTTAWSKVARAHYPDADRNSDPEVQAAFYGSGTGGEQAAPSSPLGDPATDPYVIEGQPDGPAEGAETGVTGERPGFAA